MNPPVGSSKNLGGIGRLQAILLLIGMSSLAARGESNPASENAKEWDYFHSPSLTSYAQKPWWLAERSSSKHWIRTRIIRGLRFFKYYWCSVYHPF